MAITALRFHFRKTLWHGAMMTDWQTIETAPKDIGAIIGSNGQWVLAMRWATNGMAWTSEYHRSAVVPTHWMPLPNPPKEKT